MDASSEMTKCLLCGQFGRENPESYSMISAESLPKENEIQLLQAEIQKMEDSIQEISRRRAVLQRRLNSRRSMVYKFPSEVLCHIFEYLVPNEHTLSVRSLSDSASINKCIDGSSLPLYPPLLGKVSFAWRQTIISTPKLWSTMIIRLSLNSKLRCVHALNLFLHHSGNSSFHLELEIWSKLPSFQRDIENINPLEDIIFHSQCSPRFKTLHIISAPWKWLPLVDASSLSSLVSLRWSPRREELYQPMRPSDDFDHRHTTYSLDSVTPLHRIILSDLSASFRLPLSVTVLDLCGVSVRTCLELLTHCPQLVELRYTPHEYFPYHPPVNAPLHGNLVPIQLPSLRIFEWFDVPDNLWVVLCRFHLPVVETVTVRFTTTTTDHPGIPSPATPLLFSFFSRLPQSLRELNLKNCRFLTEQFHRILYPFSGLRALALNGGLDNARDIIHMITPSSESDSSSIHTFPALKKLNLDVWCSCDKHCWSSVECSCMENIQYSLIQMLEQRLEGSNEAFQLIIDGLARNNTCSRDFITRIEALARSGKLQVTFPHDLKPPANDQDEDEKGKEGGKKEDGDLGIASAEVANETSSR